MKRVLDRFRAAAGIAAPGSPGFAVPSLTGSAAAFLAVAAATPYGAGPRCVLAVADGIPAADRLFDDLRLIAPFAGMPRLRVLEFPLPAPDDKSALGARLKTAAALDSWSISPFPCIVAAPYRALLEPASKPDSAAFRIGEGTLFGELCSALSSYGYSRQPVVGSEGEWSVRGGIVDLWPPGDDCPARAEFFGETLESVRHFDPSTQRSTGNADMVEVLPLNPGGVDSAVWLQDLMPSGSVVLALGHDSYDTAPLRRDSLAMLYEGDPPPRDAREIMIRTSALPGFGELDAKAAHHPELFGAAKARLEAHLKASRNRGAAVIEADDLSRGFELPAGNGFAGAIVVSKSDRTFTKVKARRHGGAGRRAAAIESFASLDPGEYVVHRDYGVGRYVGSSEIVTDGRRSEVFTIEYAEGAKLHIPASQAYKISRYVGVRGKEVKLHGIDGKGWQKDRDAARKSIEELAKGLLEVQARRSLVPGFAYDVDCDGYEAFKAAFPYDETPDQLSAIADVEADMADSRPMDRLVCGDAGYGKTEVAMRAAYIAAMNGRQTVVLAPTTVLAEQHFETFASRFDGTPVRIEPLSRFQSGRTHSGTFERLASGVCDIAIGTHAILSPRIRFRDLGLVVIDEEQRFGVRHKEFLKKLKATVDVLTLSATPIPRTLYMSMTGMRDLSVLRSPPRERVAVEIHVARDSDEIVADAIEREVASGGQAFFLHNRVSSIWRAAGRLERICPGKRITVAHGQMDPKELAAKMREFERGESDILLCTTIVESGIDIPAANTILVDRADAFGLSELYQLRGRVGRSSRQGHAYFLLPGSGAIAPDARERLEALRRNGAPGGGFDLAMRDLELRGAGDLLGSKQSGHIAAIGFSLYCQLLKRTVAAMKGEKSALLVDAKLNLDFIDFSPVEPGGGTASLPYSYIGEDSDRMAFMKRLAEASSAADLRSCESEMRDRFGRLPAQAKRLMSLAELKIVCSRRRVGSLDVRRGRAVFRSTEGEVVSVCDVRGEDANAKIAFLLRQARSLQGCAPNA